MATVAVIEGDGIGKEVIPAARRVLEALAAQRGLALTFRDYPLGADRYLATGVGLSQADFESLRDGCDAILLGALGDPRVPDSAHAREILLGLRRRLDLYINHRPARLLHPRLCPLRVDDARAVDMVILRENTEGLYSGAGGTIHPGRPEQVSTEVMLCTRRGVERIQRAAFELASRRGLRLCMVDKSNALRHTGALWQEVFAALRAAFPDVEARHLYVDAAAMEMVRDPSQFDVIVTGNLFGDILSDLAAMLQGGMGLAASANLHPGRHGLFEPVHGSAPDIAGQGKANPTAALLTAALLLEYLGHGEAAAALEAAVGATVLAGETTPDLGGALSTAQMTDAVLARLLA